MLESMKSPFTTRLIQIVRNDQNYLMSRINKKLNDNGLTTINFEENCDLSNNQNLITTKLGFVVECWDMVQEPFPSCIFYKVKGNSDKRLLVVDENLSQEQKYMCLAHEFAHLLADFNPAYTTIPTNLEREFMFPAKNEHEFMFFSQINKSREAGIDVLALEMLMPRKKFIKYLRINKYDFAKAAKDFAVSIEAVLQWTAILDCYPSHYLKFELDDENNWEVKDSYVSYYSLACENMPNHSYPWLDKLLLKNMFTNVNQCALKRIIVVAKVQ